VPLSGGDLASTPSEMGTALPGSSGPAALPSAAGGQSTAPVQPKQATVPPPVSAAPLRRSIVPHAGGPGGREASPPAAARRGNQNGPLIDSVLTVGPNANVTRLTGGQAESTIAIDPTNPSHLFSAYVNLTANGTTMFARYSTDGGATWAPSNINAVPSACC